MRDRHPPEGVLRRLVDEPAGVADADRAHVAACATCLAGLAAAQADAAAAGAALDVDAAVDVDAAWRRFAGAAGPGESRAAAPARRRRAPLRSPLAVGFAVLAVLAGAGAVAAADWLQIFRTERVSPVALSQADLVALPDLSAFGELEVTEPANVRLVPDARTAEAETGIGAPHVAELPRGVVGEPELRVGSRVSAEFTFSAEEAARIAEDHGEALPPPPPGLDGARFRLQGGPGLAALWTDSRDLPAMLVLRAVAPTAQSTGVALETARDYLLSLPGLPEDTAAQLRALTDDGMTLPLPIPAAEVETEEAEVNGEPATVFATRDGVIAGVVWVEDSFLNAVAGTLSDGEVLWVARGLRWGS
jgi:hypothetical protein